VGFIAPELPDVDYDVWRTRPRSERLQTLSRHWVEHGFGTPLGVYVLYILKMALYVLGAAYVISLTTGLGSLSDIATWWDEPVVYQKLIVWTLLFEVLGLGCGFGPLTLRFLPPIGGFLYWLRPGTIRLPPWPGRVPLTSGTRRGLIDVLLYLAVLASAVWLLTCPGDGSAALGGHVGVLDETKVIPLLASLAVLGLRDKTIFLAARGEQYWFSLLLFFFATPDMFLGFKLVMLACGGGQRPRI
jgi:hypothetical protein